MPPSLAGRVVEPSPDIAARLARDMPPALSMGPPALPALPGRAWLPPLEGRADTLFDAHAGDTTVFSVRIIDEHPHDVHPGIGPALGMGAVLPPLDRSTFDSAPDPFRPASAFGAGGGESEVIVPQRAE